MRNRTSSNVVRRATAEVPDETGRRKRGGARRLALHHARARDDAAGALEADEDPAARPDLFGRLALHPSVTEISDKRERGKLVNAAWRRYGVINSASLPALVGGCRPITLVDELDSRDWDVRRHGTVVAWGVASEVVIATRR